MGRDDAEENEDGVETASQVFTQSMHFLLHCAVMPPLRSKSFTPLLYFSKIM